MKFFLGFVSYYWKFYLNFAIVAKSPKVFSNKETKFHWSAKPRKHFSAIEATVNRDPFFTYPDSKHYILDTDASNKAAEAVLFQVVDKREGCGILQQNLEPSQKKYCVMLKSCWLW